MGVGNDRQMQILMLSLRPVQGEPDLLLLLQVAIRVRYRDARRYLYPESKKVLPTCYLRRRRIK